MPQMPALCWDRACPAAPQSKHSSSGITAARPLRPFPPPRNANKLLTPCNVLAFPLNPGFRQGSARRRSHQYIHNAGQSQCYCEPEVERLHSQQELHLSKEPASAALAGGTTANESGSLQQQTSCPGSGQAGAAPTLSLPFPLRREGTQAHTPLSSCTGLRPTQLYPALHIHRDWEHDVGKDFLQPWSLSPPTLKS